MKNDNGMILIYSDSRGINIPLNFVQDTGLTFTFGITDSESNVSEEYKWAVNSINEGPYSDFYWDAWDHILENAKTESGYTLYQDGDLWGINPDKMDNEEYMNFFGEIKPAPDGWYEYSACDDCIQYIANGELPECDKTEKRVTQGCNRLIDPVADCAEYGFTYDGCEVCHDGLGGYKFRVLARGER